MMDENRKDASKKDERPHKAGGHKGERKTLGDKWKDLKGEFYKIIWPSRKELAKQTATVIVTSAIVGAVIVVLDAVFAVGLTTFSSLLNK